MEGGAAICSSMLAGVGPLEVAVDDTGVILSFVPKNLSPHGRIDVTRGCARGLSGSRRLEWIG